MFAKFSRIIKNGGDKTIPSESYPGALIYSYRRKRNMSRKQLSRQLGLDEDSLLRIECGFGSKEEISFIFSKLYPDKKKSLRFEQAHESDTQ
jgi:hypothetical protein